MFELKIALKYLLLNKKRVSSSIITWISIFVISIVVWLILVFLSVTNGIEKNWISKLTSLNAPIRITPTSEYYSSYYYLADTISSNSDYSTKTIKEKYLSEKSDPYDIENDMPLPYEFPRPIYQEDVLVDPIKRLYSILDEKQKKLDGFSFQDYEISAAMLKLSLNRVNVDPITLQSQEKLHFLSQMTYLLSLTEENPNLSNLILPISEYEVEQYVANFKNNISQENKNSFFDNLEIERVTLKKQMSLDLSYFEDPNNLTVFASINENNIDLYSSKQPNLIEGKIRSKNEKLYFFTKNSQYPVNKNTNIILNDDLDLISKIDKESLKKANSYKDIKIDVEGTLKNKKISKRITLLSAVVKKANFKNNNVFSSDDKKISLKAKDNHFGVLLPKNFKDLGVIVSDKGYLSYSSLSINSNQEHRLPVYVAGFYDPGVLPIGNKCIIISPEAIRAVNKSSSTVSFDSSGSNGIFVWVKNEKKVEEIKLLIEDELKKSNIASYFNVTSYKEFDFSKDMMQQFQSDKTLFTLIAIIILIAACSNIVSMLILLVNDKIKEIAILRSLGTKSSSIAFIFGFCGFFMGIISSIIGVALAVFTLKNLDHIIWFLSKFQGHSFFNSAFFGNKMPNELSINALMFVLIITPAIAIIAGLIPAIKACRVKPSNILRS